MTRRERERDCQRLPKRPFVPTCPTIHLPRQVRRPAATSDRLAPAALDRAAAGRLGPDTATADRTARDTAALDTPEALAASDRAAPEMPEQGIALGTGDIGQRDTAAGLAPDDAGRGRAAPGTADTARRGMPGSDKPRSEQVQPAAAAAVAAAIVLAARQGPKVARYWLGSPMRGSRPVPCSSDNGSSCPPSTPGLDSASCTAHTRLRSTSALPLRRSRIPLSEDNEYARQSQLRAKNAVR